VTTYPETIRRYRIGTSNVSPGISDKLFLDYLQCKYKAFLNLSGKSGVKSDFETFQDETHVEYCQRARERLSIAGGSISPPAVNSTFNNKHKSEAQRFIDKMELKDYSSESAKGFQKRFAKYKDKLFTFLAYDGVPWNNNNAEHAIKRFVSLRKVIGGVSTAKGIQEYLILLSICETLRLRNASFFRFLLSGETDIDKFLERKTNRLA